jgi:hypothetical protein
MPVANGIKTIMRKKKIPDELMASFDCPSTSEGKPIDRVLALINKMDELLTKEQRLDIMQNQGCCKTAKHSAPFREFGLRHAEKPFGERVELFAEHFHNPKKHLKGKPPCWLNSDGTFSVHWASGKDGGFKCVCAPINKLPKPINVSRTYCGCCAGHVRHNYQYALGVKLRLKEIVSSPLDTGGKEFCEFLFEVIV